MLPSWAVFLIAAPLWLGACSSSDDVVASVDELSPGALPSAQAGGTPLLVVQLGVPTAPGAPAPAGASLAPPIAGTTSAGIGRPPPPHVGAIGEALFVSGTAQSPPRAGAERWPLDEPLRKLFLPASEHHQRLLVLSGPGHDPLRELAARHGLGVAAGTVQVLVEDDAGDQFELTISEDPPLADGPSPASD